MIKLLEGGKKFFSLDGWNELLSGWGGPKDNLKDAKFSANSDISEFEAESLYIDDGLGGRIVNKPTGDMVREWFKVIGDPEGDVNRFLHQKLKAMNNIRKALKWNDVYGGSVVQMGIMDGRELIEPVDLNNIRAIEFLRVYDRYRISIHASNTSIQMDPSRANFGMPTIVQISPISSFTPMSPFEINTERLLMFQGKLTSARKMNLKEGWGDSVFVSTKESIRDYALAHHSAAYIIKGFNQIILTMDGLADMLAAGEDKLIKERLNIMDFSRSIMNMILLDKEEKFDIQSQSAGGVSQIILTMINRVSTSTGIPPSILIGQAKSGLNSKATEDQDLYNALIKERQIFDLKPQMERLVEIVMLSKDGPTNGKIIDDWAIEFNPLETPSEMEVAQQRDKTADTDIKYLNVNVLTPQEVRNSRFSGQEYNIETQIDPNLDLELEPEEETPNDKPGNDPNADKSNADLHGHFLTSGFTNGHAHNGFVDFDGNGKLSFNFTAEGEQDHEHSIENWVVEEVNGHIHGIVKGI